MSYFSKTYGYKKGDFPNAEKIGDMTLTLPFYPSMPAAHALEVVEILKQVFTAGSAA